MRRLLISTGEVSGDLQGGLLVAALRAEAEERGLPLEIKALGGERMRAAGATLLANTKLFLFHPSSVLASSAKRII